MAKSNRGGQGAMKAQVQPTPPTPPTPPVQPAPAARQPVNAQQLWQDAKTKGSIDLTESGVTLADVQQMNDKDLHDILLAITKQDLPDYLMPNNQQRFVYALGINQKPIIEDDATFAKNAKGQQVIFNAQRSVTLGGYTLTGDEIQDFIKFGDDTLQQHGIHGNGINFTNQGASAGYGDRQSAARFNPATAKIISETQLKREYDSWVQTHPLSRKALGYMSRNGNTYGNNTYSQFALLRGYNVISATQHGGMYVVLDRSALIFSKSTKRSGTWSF